MSKAVAKLNRLDIAPRKTRSVARIIAGLPVGDAEAELIFRKERASKPILKLLRSAVANAKNAGMDVDSLFVKEIRVDKGLRMKRWLPRARGMATPIHKDFSNVIIVLEENKEQKGKFEILSRSPKLKKTVLRKEGAESVKTEEKEEKKKAKKGILGIGKKKTKKEEKDESAKKEEVKEEIETTQEVAPEIVEENQEVTATEEESTSEEVVAEEEKVESEEEKETKESN